MKDLEIKVVPKRTSIPLSYNLSKDFQKKLCQKLSFFCTPGIFIVNTKYD